MSPQEVYLLLTQNEHFRKLSPRQKAVVLMVINPDFRSAIASNMPQTIIDLTVDDLKELQSIDNETLNGLIEQYRAGLGLAQPETGAITISALPAFVAGMAVGYAAYAYAAKY